MNRQHAGFDYGIKQKKANRKGALLTDTKLEGSTFHRKRSVRQRTNFLIEFALFFRNNRIKQKEVIWLLGLENPRNPQAPIAFPAHCT